MDTLEATMEGACLIKYEIWFSENFELIERGLRTYY